MAGSFRIAEGFVEVTADESNYDRAIQRLKSKKTTATVTLDIDDSAALAKLRRFADEHSRTVLKAIIDADLSETSVRRVSAALDRLTKDRVVNIRASVDTRVGAAEIRNLTQRRQVRIGIDVDTRVAADSLANLTRRRSMTVQARADTADADTRLRHLTRDRNVNVRTRLLGGLGGLAGLGSSAGGSAGGVGILSSRIAKLAAAAVGALPTLASLGQSLVAMGPAAALAAPAVLSLSSAFTAVKVGTSGIGDAFKAAKVGGDQLNEALAKLAPNARQFVQAVLDQGTAWRGLKLDVQNTLFAGLGQTFTTMSTAILPSLRAGLTGTAEILNQTAKNAAGAVTELGKTGALRQMFDGLNQGMQHLTRIPGQFITGLTQISIAASPAFKRLTTAAGNAADRISKRLSDAFKSGSLENSISGAVDIAKQFGQLLGDIFGTVGNIMGAAAKGGGNALGILGSVFSELRKITAMPEVQSALTSVFGAISKIGGMLAGVLGKTLQAVLPMVAPIADAITGLLTNAGPLLPLIGALLLKFNPVLGVMTMLAPIIGQLSATLTPLIKIVMDLVTSFVDSLKPVMDAVIKAAGSLITALGTALQPVLQALVPIVAAVGQFIGQLAPLFPPLIDALLPLIPPLGELAVSLLNLAMQVITPLMPLIVGLARLLTGVLAGAIGILVPVITTVIGWITTFTDAITAGVKWVVDKFTWLYDTLVGHSIIPDLVKAIVDWFTNLWKSTVQIFTQIKNWVVDTWNKLWKAASDRWHSFWSGLWKSLLGAKTSVMNWLNGLKSWFANAWSGMWNSAASKLSSVLGSLRKGLDTFKRWMLDAVRALRDGSGKLWAGIQGKMSTPIKWVVAHVYNDGVRKMWNTIAGKISSKITLPYIKLGFSQGGVVPGKPSNKDTVPAMLAPGERVLSNPEVAKLGGHTAIDTLLGQTPRNPTRQDQNKPVPGFVDGGIMGALGSAASWAKNLVVGGLESAARKAINAIIKPLINRIPGGSLGTLMRGLSNKALSGILGWFGGQDKKAGQVDYTPGAGVAQWKPQIIKALQILGQSSGWLGTVQRRMNQESGGNPRAVNNWDINAKNGMPSTGLLQVIRPTFQAYAGRFRNTGPFLNGVSIAPLPNIYSGLNYAIHRYGSLSALNRPGGYDNGGLLQPGATLAINRTGKPEAVLNPEDRAKFEALVRSGGEMTISFGDVIINGASLATKADRQKVATSLVVEIKEALRQFDRGRA